MRLEVDPLRPARKILERAASILREGGLVAFPTETVYGVGANALDDAAVRRIFAAKGRPAFNPLIAHVADLAAARDIALEWPAAAERLAAAFWPGPLTLVVPKRPDVPDAVTAGLGTVAVRVPRHPVAHRLLELAGVPVAAPSANRFTEISPTTADHVEKGLGGRIDLILDGGPTAVGIESTVIDVSQPELVLLRPGSLSRSALEAVVGPLRTSGELLVEGSAPRPSPGMLQKHYAPRARLRVFHPHERALMAAAAREAASRGECVGALLLDALDAPAHRAVRMPASAPDYARRLYAALHELDDLRCELILVDAPPADAEWTGIRDRLSRAAHSD